MYTTNLIIAHNVKEKEQLYSCLDRICSLQQCGIQHGAQESLLEVYFIHPQTDDYCFELIDVSDNNSSGMFLGINYSSETTKDCIQSYLNKCFEILKNVVNAVLAFCSDIEIFITTNRASMEDFSTHTIEISNLTDLLRRLFDNCLNSDGVDPEIHLFVHREEVHGEIHAYNRGTIL